MRTARRGEGDARAVVMESLQRLVDCSRLFRSGMESSSQGVARELRRMLLDGRSGLLSRAVGKPTLHPLRGPSEGVRRTPRSRPTSREGRLVLVFDFQGSAVPADSSPAFAVEMARDQPPLALEAWLEQSLPPAGVTIGALIETCAKSGGQPAAAGEDGSAITPAEYRLRRAAIVALGDYVVERTLELMGDHPRNG